MDLRRVRAAAQRRFVLHVRGRLAEHHPGSSGARSLAALHGLGAGVGGRGLHRLRAGRRIRADGDPGKTGEFYPGHDLSRLRHQRPVRNAAESGRRSGDPVPVHGRRPHPRRRRRVLHRSGQVAARPQARRPGQDLRRGIGAVRHDLGERRIERGVGGSADHPDDDSHRIQSARRRGDRGRGLDRRPAHAAGDGSCGLPDGRIPGNSLREGRACGGDTGGPLLSGALLDRWHFIIPFVALIFMLFYYDSSPENAALSAAVVIFVTGMIRGYRRPRLKISDLFRSLAATGRTTTDLVTTLAAAGFVIGVLNSSGLGFALTLWLVGLAGNSLPVLLVISAFVALILGMGMPTTAVYVLLAVLAAPALVQAGVMKLAAHMFILYFGMLSMITPPVALAAYAASTISKAGPMETGWAACRIGWAKFVLPFMFVLSPTLLLQGAAASIAFDILTAMAGVYIATCGLVGYFMRPLSPPWRVLLCVAGLAAIIPDSQLSFLFPGLISVSGIAVGFALLLADYLAARRRASPA
ncbi:MAG: TRAP transporter large permease subunit [Betaproteobacteria bacterium]|nr:TRAP transporter large permease subunit [Betaproteobacteria bacterium]